jgi:hypothetical protein
MTERNRESGRAPEVCAHLHCVCEIGADAVTYKGKKYCSDACAKGYGCDHDVCRCGDNAGGTERRTHDY